MLTVGDRIPPFKLTAAVERTPGKEFSTVTHESYPGKWLILFFWPKDFTFVCPTEIAAFGQKDSEFKQRNAQVLGASTDNEYVHLAWREHDKTLRELPFPMLSDIKRDLSSALGILDKDAGVALRATFIVNPEGIIQWVSVNNLDTGRNVEEVVRALDALQTGELTPCGWQPGQATL
ncbi:MAG TPA: peroxiredoxin [Polyangiaceae bacterium]|jgi:peroxiredoxin (alkyl hydroperoxide reductase subunit C)|nr:peroxiredoxin [Polyangiaceae bacterium]